MGDGNAFLGQATESFFGRLTLGQRCEEVREPACGKDSSQRIRAHTMAQRAEYTHSVVANHSRHLGRKKVPDHNMEIKYHSQ